MTRKNQRVSAIWARLRRSSGLRGWNWDKENPVGFKLIVF